MLARLGVAPHVARLLAVTPSLTVSWFGAVAIALAVAVAGSYQGERGLVLFLCVAALAPVAGVAATFGRGIDPTHELALAAPMSSVRLLLLRTVAVVAVTLVVTAGRRARAARAVVDRRRVAAAGARADAARASRWPPTSPTPTAFGTVAGLWVAATIAAAVRPDDALAAFDGVSQLVLRRACCASRPSCWCGAARRSTGGARDGHRHRSDQAPGQRRACCAAWTCGSARA